VILLQLHLHTESSVPIVSTKSTIHTNSFAAWKGVIYSASVDESATQGCFIGLLTNGTTANFDDVHPNFAIIVLMTSPFRADESRNLR
jgi:hypothetical protein